MGEETNDEADADAREAADNADSHEAADNADSREAADDADSQESGSDGAEEPEAIPVVRRNRQESTNQRGRVFGLGGLVALLVVGLVGWWSPWSSQAADPRPVSATSTTSAAPIPEEVASGPVAPLTGIPVAGEDAARLMRPALVSKIDGDRKAMPQEGLDSADLVIEVRVEGISRYLSVWHSSAVDTVGPVRSARTTDLDLLSMFAKPLFSYSGGNAGVLSSLRRADWFVDVSHDAVPPAYSREQGRVAPHNLMADTGMLWDRAPDVLAVPPAQFEYLAPGEVAPGEAVPAFAVSVGSEARFAWDPELGGWRRWAYGIRHDSTSGAPLAPNNVVVIAVDYRSSAADRASPEAVSVGNGAAWVFTQGSMQEGVWYRDDMFSTWELTDVSGEPMKLTPGTTWVALADAEPLGLGEAEAASLLAPPQG